MGGEILIRLILCRQKSYAVDRVGHLDEIKMVKVSLISKDGLIILPILQEVVNFLFVLFSRPKSLAIRN